MDIQIFVQNVKRILDERGISYSRAGIESGAGIDFIRNMDRKGTEPSIGKVMQMASYLGISVGELLGEEKGPAPVAEGEPIYPPEYDFLSPEDKALVDNMIRSLSKKQQASYGPTKLYIAARDGSRMEVELDEEIILPDESDEIPE